MNRPTPKRFLPLIAIIAAIVLVAIMVATREPPPRDEGENTPARLVRTASVTRTPQRIDVLATGTVIPSREVELQPQIGGRVIAVHEQLQPGSVVRKGTVLVTVEPTDFEAAVAEAEAQYARARADLDLEKGRSEVAAAEFESYAESLDVPVDSFLALRRPQYEAAAAAVKQAEARLRRARADLDRTTLEAPFDALVVSESVDVGAQIGPQTRVARLVSADRYWVRATLPIEHLSFVAVPGFNAEEGARATIIQDAGALRIRREGRVLRLYGEVTPRGRLAQLLIEVTDPLARDTDRDVLPLLLDSFVNVELQGRGERELIRLPREYLRERDTVWVYDEGNLNIRPVDVIWRAPEYVLIESGLEDGERVVTSPLTNPVQGLRLKQTQDDDA